MILRIKIFISFDLAPTDNLSFILINLREHMTEFTSAILRTLDFYASKFILTIDDHSIIDFSQWSKQSATIFTTAQSVSSLQNLPKRLTVVLYDVHNTNIEQPRFTSIDKLIGRLVDEVIEKYRNSTDENIISTASSNTELINKKVNRIYSDLEQIHQKYHSKSSSMPTVDCPAPVLVFLIVDRAYDNEETRSIGEEFKDYFSSPQYISDENECLVGENTMDMFWIICGCSNQALGNRLRQNSRVKYFYYFEESREKSNERMITNENDLRYRLAYDLLEYYGNLGEQYQANRQTRKAREMFSKARNLCQILSNFFPCD